MWGKLLCRRWGPVALIAVLGFTLFWVSKGALRRRFEAIEIGMPRHQVHAMLGKPHLDHLLENLWPTHAIIVETGEFGLRSTQYGPDSKNYLAYLSVNDQSEYWMNERQQIVVNYDRSKRVQTKIWLEVRSWVWF